MNTVIVTGGGRGIGAAIVKRFEQLGSRVYALDRAHPELDSSSGAVIPLITDISDAEEMNKCMTRIHDDTGRIDTLVNNAGVRVTGDVIETSLEDWDRLMHVNLRAVFITCKFALPYMLERGRGAIVNIASMAALNPMWDRAAYCASKAGVIGLTKQMALQYARRGVRVNAVCPGPTLTPFMESQLARLPDAEEARSRYETRQPIGRFADPDHIAQAVAYLASDAAEVVTGTTLDVDCGTTLINAQGASGRLAS